MPLDIAKGREPGAGWGRSREWDMDPTKIFIFHTILSINNLYGFKNINPICIYYSLMFQENYELSTDDNFLSIHMRNIFKYINLKYIYKSEGGEPEGMGGKFNPFSIPLS